VITIENEERKKEGTLSGILKSEAKSILKIALIVIIIVVLLAVSVWHIQVEDGSYREDDWGNPGFVVNEMITSNINAENIAANESGGYSINIDLDTKVEDVIKKLEEENGPINKYISESKVKQYLTDFIRAELITQYPDLRSADKIGTDTENNEFHGCIQVHRAASNATDGTTQILTYIDYSTFSSYISNNNLEVTNHFTLDSSGNLVVAGWTRTTTSVTSNEPDVENMLDRVEFKLIEKSIPYKSLVEVYTMPFDFLWALTVKCGDEDFAHNVSQLALDSKIILTVQDNLTISVTERIEEYDIREKVEKEGNVTITQNDNYEPEIFQKIQVVNENTPQHYETKITRKTEDCAVNINLTYADTWIVEYSNSYSNMISDEKTDTPEPEMIDDSEYELIKEGTLTSDEQISQKVKNFLIQKYGSEEQYLNKIQQGEIVSIDQGPIYYKRYTKTQNKKVTNKVTSSYNIYVQGTPSTVEKVESNSEENNFVKLFLDSGTAKNNIRGTADWLFQMLETSPKAADMIDITKYLLYKATNITYGVLEYDFGIYEPSNFKTSGGSSRGLAAYLRQFSHSGEAPQSDDGNYYMMYGDGVGWPTIGTADLQWASHYTKFNIQGKIIHKGQEKEVENVAKYISDNCLKQGAEAKYTDEEIENMQIGIEKSLVDNIGNSILQIHYAKVQESIEGLNLSRQQLYALTSISYNFGSLPTRNNKTFKQTYEEGMQQFEEGSWEHNKYIWDNWWSRVGGGAAGHIPSRDAAFETYIKAIFDFSESDAGEVFGRKYYIYYTDSQLALFDYAPSKTITRTVSNEQEIFTLVKASGTFEADYSNPKVIGYYTSTMGKVFTVLNQNKITNWGDKCNRAAAAIIASSYSEQTADELINIIDNNKRIYQWNSVPTDDYFNLYGLKVDEEVYGNLGVSEYTSKIREQLELGGYAMIWVNNGGAYYGKSGEKWTSKYHWVAIVDYRIENGVEEIMILDWRGGDWYPIDEFQFGIAHYALISEK